MRRNERLLRKAVDSISSQSIFKNVKFLTFPVIFTSLILYSTEYLGLFSSLNPQIQFMTDAWVSQLF
jgi:hypothetical protein